MALDLTQVLQINASRALMNSNKIIYYTTFMPMTEEKGKQKAYIPYSIIYYVDIRNVQIYGEFL